MKLFEMFPWKQDFSSFNGWCIVYFQHEVLIGSVCNGDVYFHHTPDIRKLIEIYVFNENIEYRALKRADNFVFRVLDDHAGNFFYDESMLIIGNDKFCSKDHNFQTVSEKGRHIILPADWIRKRIVIRNYMAFSSVDEQLMPGCEIMRLMDWRYAGITEEA